MTAHIPDAKEPPHCPTCSCAPGSWGDHPAGDGKQISDHIEGLEWMASECIAINGAAQEACRAGAQALREIKALREAMSSRWVRVAVKNEAAEYIDFDRQLYDITFYADRSSSSSPDAEATQPTP